MKTFEAMSIAAVAVGVYEGFRCLLNKFLNRRITEDVYLPDNDIELSLDDSNVLTLTNKSYTEKIVCVSISGAPGYELVISPERITKDNQFYINNLNDLMHLEMGPKEVRKLPLYLCTMPYCLNMPRLKVKKSTITIC